MLAFTGTRARWWNRRKTLRARIFEIARKISNHRVAVHLAARAPTDTDLLIKALNRLDALSPP